ncbi:MAG: hypothetical protein ACFFCS_01915 [Candidatus Hodarchaeota archaeon]
MKSVMKLLFQYWKEEQFMDEISPLPVDFETSVREFLSYLDDELDNPENDEIQKAIIEGEMERISFMWNDLLKIRKNKIDSRVASRLKLNGVPLLDFENDYFSAMSSVLEHYNAHEISISRKTPEITEHAGYVLLRLLEDMKEIMGIDLKVYGPFKKEDIVYLPKENAEILLGKQVAKPVVLGEG